MRIFLLLSMFFLFFSCSNNEQQEGTALELKHDTLTVPAYSTTLKGIKDKLQDSVKSKHKAEAKKVAARKFGAAPVVISVGTGSGTVQFDGSGKTIDTIKVKAGTYANGVLFANVNGTPMKPVVIINDGGQVICNGGSDASLDLSTCRYVHVTGTGAKGIQYGFLTAGGPTADFDAHYGTSDAEIDHIECGKSLYAGLVFRTYPSTGCSWSITGGNGPATQAQMNAPSWAIYNMLIHDNYVHDVPGEGMYLGQSHYGNADAFSYTPVGGNPLGGCSSGNESPVIGAKVYNNIVKNVGSDGIQMSGCISGCSVNYNTIIGFATGNQDGQDGGVTWNPGSVGSVDHNWIEYTGTGTVSMGVMYQGQGDVLVTNNVIKGNGKGQVGIALLRNTQQNVKGSTHQNILIANNTIVGFLTGYWFYGDNGFGTFLSMKNNLVVAPTIYSTGNGTITQIQKFTNLEVTSFSGFRSSTDLRLTAGSLATGKGTAIAEVTNDYNNIQRKAPYDIGAYAFDTTGGGTVTPPADTVIVTVRPDTVINLPAGQTVSGSINLSGSAVSNTGSLISSFMWLAAAGTFTNPLAQNTAVSGLPVGINRISFTVKDAAGTTGTAFVQITVNGTGCPTCPPIPADRKANRLSTDAVGNIWVHYDRGADSTKFPYTIQALLQLK